jgi:hypothetical protein
MVLSRPRPETFITARADQLLTGILTRRWLSVVPGHSFPVNCQGLVVRTRCMWSMRRSWGGAGNGKGHSQKKTSVIINNMPVGVYRW